MTYGNSVIQVTTETFGKWENGLLEKVMDMNWTEYMVWIVPGQFYGEWYINDAWHFPGHTAPKAERLNNRSKNNV